MPLPDELSHRCLLPPLRSSMPTLTSHVPPPLPPKLDLTSSPVKITSIKAVSLPMLDISRFSAEPKGDQKLIGQFIALARGGQLNSVKPAVVASIHPEYFARLAMAEIAHVLSDLHKIQLNNAQKAALQHGQRYLDNPAKYTAK